MALGRGSVVGIRLCSRGRRYDKHVVNWDWLRLANAKKQGSVPAKAKVLVIVLGVQNKPYKLL